MKTKEEKAKYCREWRLKNRERYLKHKRALYAKNQEQYRDEAKERSKRYYYEIHKPKREANPILFRALDRQHSIKRREVRRSHLKDLRTRLGGKCCGCGYEENIDILQFHHHRGDKIRNVTEFQDYKKREAEALKCILLCPNCHAIETLKETRT